MVLSLSVCGSPLTFTALDAIHFRFFTLDKYVLWLFSASFFVRDPLTEAIIIGNEPFFGVFLSVPVLLLLLLSSSSSLCFSSVLKSSSFSCFYMLLNVYDLVYRANFSSCRQFASRKLFFFALYYYIFFMIYFVCGFVCEPNVSPEKKSNNMRLRE